jgi:hypothetical protein
MPRASLPIRLLKRSIMTFVCGVRGRVWQYSAPNWAHAPGGSREAASVVGQHGREPEGNGGGGLTQEGDGTPFGLIVSHGQMH